MKNLINIKNVSNLVNLVPGTPKYTGNKKTSFKIELIMYNKFNLEKKEFAETKDFTEFIKNCSLTDYNSIWINVIGLANTKKIIELTNYFEIPIINTESIVDISNHSEMVIGDDYIFSNLQMIYLDHQEIIQEKISIYKIKNIIITFQENETDIFNSIRGRIENSEGKIRNNNNSYLYYTLFDSLIDYYVLVENHIYQKLSIIENEIYNYKNNDMEAIFKAKRLMAKLRFIVEPILTHFEKLINLNNFYFPEKEFYINLLISHIKGLEQELRVALVTVDTITDLSININSYKMNRTMTMLTIFSAIFIPLSFITGLFGMNFTQMPLINYEYGFNIFIVMIFISVITMSIILYKRK